MSRRLAVIAAGAALVGGCGDGGEAKSRSVTVKSGKLHVVAREYSFDPSKVVVESGRVGRVPLEITLDNKGSLAHNLKVFDGAKELGGTPAFQGGEARRGTVGLSPGEYVMVCTVGNHEELGMVGTLEVRAKR